MRYKIVGDSCCDYSDCQEDLSFIQRVPLILELDNQQYLDNETLSTESFLKKMEASENAPKSACPSVGAYMEAFEGGEEVYVVTLSEKVSGSYNCACTAAELYLAAKGRARHRDPCV